jgi:hypothetical protein
MKKILVAAVIALAVTSFALSRTRDNVPSQQDGNVQQTNQSQCATLTFLTESLPDFHLGAHENFTIEAIGGTPPYSFEITGGTLPAGLKFKRNGTIKGVPTEEADTIIFVKLTDSQGCSLTQAFALRVVTP